MAFFDRTRTGELINRLSADTAVVGRSLTDNLSDGLRAVAQAVGGVSMMVGLHKRDQKKEKIKANSPKGDCFDQKYAFF